MVMTLSNAGNFVTGAGPMAVVAGDFNGDGKQDVAVANFHDNTVSVLLGTGTGTFLGKQDFVAGASPQFLSPAISMATASSTWRRPTPAALP